MGKVKHKRREGFWRFYDVTKSNKLEELIATLEHVVSREGNPLPQAQTRQTPSPLVQEDGPDMRTHHRTWHLLKKHEVAATCTRARLAENQYETTALYTTPSDA